jgi:hypothetical protein
MAPLLARKYNLGVKGALDRGKVAKATRSHFTEPDLVLWTRRHAHEVQPN